jgi:hypothetical protein
VATLTSDGRGGCKVSYFSGQISGIERITATAGSLKSEVKIPVQIQGLQELPEAPTRYVRVGTPLNHAGTNDPCRSDIPRSQHFLTHFGRDGLITAIERIADRVRDDADGVRIRVNDMSLVLGGLFDIGNDWTHPHRYHRDGRHVDIGFRGVNSSGGCVEIDLLRLRLIIEEETGSPVLSEPGHYHAVVR